MPLGSVAAVDVRSTEGSSSTDGEPRSADDEPRLADVGEAGVLAQIFPVLPTGRATLLGPGDDAAVLRAADGRVVVSTDVLVEGRHFRRDWSTGFDVGWRAAAQNLADVAAMGSRPTAVVVGLVAPPWLEVAWVVDLARGLAAACGPHGAGVVGGDLTAGEQVVVAVTVHGDLAGRTPVLRSGARPGDVLAHAGVRGWSAAGYALLAAGREDAAGPGATRLVEAYRRPSPPLAAGPWAAAAGATAMLDVSDGLLRDAGRIAAASGVVLDLADPALAFADDLAVLGPAAAALGADPREWVLAGGEDHGLLATFRGDPPEPFRAVGRVLAPAPGQEPGVLVAGGAVTGAVGWDHYRR